MPYMFLGSNNDQVSEIENMAKNDPAKAAKEYQLKKVKRGKLFLIFSDCSDMQGSAQSTMSSCSGHLTGNEEQNFLKAIKDIK